MSKIKPAPKFARAAEVRAASFSEADNTVEVIWTTGAAVRRFDWQSGEPYQEVLEVSASAVRLNRLNAGAPLLDSHDSGSLRSVIGSVVPGSAKIEGGVGVARVRLSDAPEDAGTVGKIRSGIVRNVSVGYRVLKVRKIEHAKADTEWRVIDWEPLEISAVPVPADAGAQFRADNDDVAPVEFIEDSDTVAARAETFRVGTITELAESAKLQEFGRQHVAKGTSVDAFRSALLDELYRKSEATPIFGGIPAHVGAEHSEKRAQAVREALLHRSDPGTFPLTEAAKTARGLDLIDMAREVLESHGTRTRGMTREEVVSEALVQRTGYHGTSDFPAILSNVANTTLRAAYEAAPQTFRPFVRETTVPDFKVVDRVQLGEGPAFDKVNEHGEFKHGSLSEAKESYRIFTYGKIIGLTRQALVNDNFNAFGRLPAEFGKQAAQLESDLVWAQILGNPVMGDGLTLFHASHRNMAQTPLPLLSASAVAALSGAATAMALQKGLDGRTTLNVRPKFLLTGEDSRSDAEKIVEQQFRPTEAVHAVPSRVRDLQIITDPRVDLGINRPDLGINLAGDGHRWWLAVAPSWIDTIEIAYLEGAGKLSLDTRVGFDIDGVELKASIDVGAKAIDWRGLHQGN